MAQALDRAAKGGFTFSGLQRLTADNLARSKQQPMYCGESGKNGLARSGIINKVAALRGRVRAVAGRLRIFLF